MESKAVLRVARVSPRKARLVAGLIRGRDVAEALEVLTFTRKKSAGMFKNLVESAVANAEHAAERKDQKLNIDNLIVQEVYVNEGPTLRRFRPRARGMATRIRKRTSHITVILQSE